MKVKDNPGSHEAGYQGGENEEVGKIVQLNDRIALFEMQSCDPTECQTEEGQIFHELNKNPPAFVSANGKPENMDTIDIFADSFSFLAQAENIDGTPFFHKGLCFSLNSCFAVWVVSVNDHTVLFRFNSHFLYLGIRPEFRAGWFPGPVEIVYNKFEHE
jgi:hypothetical protein